MTTSRPATHLAYAGDCLDVLPALTPQLAGQITAVVIDPPYDEGPPSHWRMSTFRYDDSRGGQWASWLRARLEASVPLLADGAPVAVTIGHTRVHELWGILRDIWPGREVVTIAVDTGPRPPARGVIHRAEYILIAVEPGTVLGAPGFTQGETRTGWAGMGLSGFDASVYPNQVYPVWVERSSGRIVGAGRSVQQLIDAGELHAGTVFGYTDAETPPAGCESIWPITRTGRRVVWRAAREKFDTLHSEGWVKADRPHMPGNPQAFVIKYLAAGTLKRIAAGEIKTHGHDERGALIIGRARPVGAGVPTVWAGERYESEAGTARLRALLGDDARFAYPKPIGTVTDIVTAITGGDPDAVVLDFFAGTGTLYDAVVQLNVADGGNRRAVMITLDEQGIFTDVLLPRAAAVRAELADPTAEPLTIGTAVPA